MRRWLASDPSEERGTIIVLSALAMVVLLLFAALAVDLGALWASRRTSQNAADAAVMAGALEYVETGDATSEEVVDIVRDYASRNVDIPADSGMWLTCTDPEGLADGFVPLVDSDGNTIECISLKQGATGEDEVLLRVRLPDRDIPTSFAKLAGFDSFSVAAYAVAELRYSELAAVLPLSVPMDHGAEECLGTPPSGQLKLNEAVACTGPDSGNFGLLDSPFFESHTIAGATLNGCHDSPYPNFNTRAPFNLAAGLDHPIQAWDETVYGTIPSGDLGSKAPGVDSCDLDSTDPGVKSEVPFVMATQTGNRDLIQGLIGAGLYDGKEGRLRETNPRATATSGYTPHLSFDVTGSGDFALDNIGLWEYLTATGNASDLCSSRHYDPAFSDVRGRQATDDMALCLEGARASGSVPSFDDDLLYSPRFALVPVLSYRKGDLKGFTGSEYRAVIELKPVYLQTTWFNCGSNAKKDPCWFFPTPPEPDPSATTTTTDPTTTTEPPEPTEGYSILFNPGEGSISPKLLNKDSLDTPKKIEVEGVTAFVLEWDWLPEGAENQLGEVAPLSVSLYE